MFLLLYGVLARLASACLLIDYETFTSVLPLTCVVVDRAVVKGANSEIVLVGLNDHGLFIAFVFNFSLKILICI